MPENKLIRRATEDRHTSCCADQFCKVCGSHVSTYSANAALIGQRPLAKDEDYWIACDEADCDHAYGEPLGQDSPDWITRKEKLRAQ